MHRVSILRFVHVRQYLKPTVKISLDQDGTGLRRTKYLLAFIEEPVIQQVTVCKEKSSADMPLVDSQESLRSSVVTSPVFIVARIPFRLILVISQAAVGEISRRSLTFVCCPILHESVTIRPAAELVQSCSAQFIYWEQCVLFCANDKLKLLFACSSSSEQKFIT